MSLLSSVWRRRRGVGDAKDGGARRLDRNDREKLLSVVRLGCPRATAAKSVGLTGEQLEALVQVDEELMRDLLRAEAQIEMRHMGNVHKASSDEKNWRTSVWWLEHLRKGGAGEAGEFETGVPEAVLTALERFAELIVAEIPDVTRRQSLLTKLLHIALESVEPTVVIDVGAMALTDGGAASQEHPLVPSP